VDGILADLGVASHHFDEADRGFSFRYDALLDMRMNKASRINAGNVVNEYPQDELIRIFKSYGDFPGVHRLVSGIISARRSRPIRKTKELAKLVVELLKPKNENKILAQVFQALRIEVNGEMEVLKQMLHKSACSLNPGGRLVIITYHSVEDRLVKNYFKSGNFSGVKEADIYGRSDVPFEIVNRKVITPDEKEIQQNSRARSAKLRIAEKN
ncbi:MAG: 16S rRNA (cytosine(1402)-N(4))-methyltransferase, partial [Marinilabiliales bacterium]